MELSRREGVGVLYDAELGLGRALLGGGERTQGQAALAGARAAAIAREGNDDVNEIDRVLGD